jgi:hypothetical protein
MWIFQVAFPQQSRADFMKFQKVCQYKWLDVRGRDFMGYFRADGKIKHRECPFSVTWQMSHYRITCQNASSGHRPGLAIHNNSPRFGIS